MNYQVYNMGAYRIHCVRLSKFKKTKVVINFKRKAKQSDSVGLSGSGKKSAV